ncbi:circadian clock KaiB family protein [Archangium sp.]|uniref:circadian clock KaiB family protein n=1 Tax=Archangium sp. TaxID=1872627 RepID=UPI002D50AA70|nr:circadian clock KaiB family protein [Archangium sp.]HYO51672.1 circadian clock KaiB family protein [Archangium sp.]
MMAASDVTRPSRQVLYVDDDAASRYLLGRVLENEGFVVTLAAGVREGLELLRRHRFSLVISDYRMPDGTGTWMLKQAASAGLLEGTEVLLFTGSTHVEGAAGLKVVSKEHGTDHIVAQVLKLLGPLHPSHQEDPPSRNTRPLVHQAGAMARIELVLYTAGRSPASMRALRQMKNLLAQYESAQVDFKVFDLAEGRPASAEEDHILLTPTLVQRSPPPRTWVVGDLEDTTLVADLLDHSGVERKQ